MDMGINEARQEQLALEILDWRIAYETGSDIDDDAIRNRDVQMFVRPLGQAGPCASCGGRSSRACAIY